MQTDKERFKVAAFYYGKAAEIGAGAASKLIQARHFGDSYWCDFTGSDEDAPTKFVGSIEYRIKPEAVMHKGGEYPKPCYSAGEMHSAGLAYFPNFTLSYSGEVLAKAEMADCQDINNCEMFASTGLYHLTRKAAIAHAKVIYQIED